MPPSFGLVPELSKRIKDKRLRYKAYQENFNLSSFVGAFPINDPQYLILVLIEKPKPQIEKLHHHFTTGGQVAAPVVKEIVNKIAPILNIHPIVTDLPKIEQALKLDLLSNEVRLTNASF